MELLPIIFFALAVVLILGATAVTLVPQPARAPA